MNLDLNIDTVLLPAYLRGAAHWTIQEILMIKSKPQSVVSHMEIEAIFPTLQIIIYIFSFRISIVAIQNS